MIRSKIGNEYFLRFERSLLPHIHSQLISWLLFEATRRTRNRRFYQIKICGIILPTLPPVKGIPKYLLWFYENKSYKNLGRKLFEIKLELRKSTIRAERTSNSKNKKQPNKPRASSALGRESPTVEQHFLYYWAQQEAIVQGNHLISRLVIFHNRR